MMSILSILGPSVALGLCGLNLLLLVISKERIWKDNHWLNYINVYKRFAFKE